MGNLVVKFKMTVPVILKRQNARPDPLLLSIGVAINDNISVERVMQAIDLSIDIPDGSKRAVKDFIEAKFEELVDNYGSISDIDIPSEVSEYIPYVIDIIKTFISG